MPSRTAVPNTSRTVTPVNCLIDKHQEAHIHRSLHDFPPRNNLLLYNLRWNLYTDYAGYRQCRYTKCNGYQYIQQQTTNKDWECHPKRTKTTLLKQKRRKKIQCNSQQQDSFVESKDQSSLATYPYPFAFFCYGRPCKCRVHPPNQITCLHGMSNKSDVEQAYPWDATKKLIGWKSVLEPLVCF